MIRVKAFSISTLIAASALAYAPTATAQAPTELTEYVWDSSKTGSQPWSQATNWTPAGSPNGPLHSANLSVPLGANLTVNITGEVTVAGLKLGGTAAARTTEISGGTRLIFRNDLEPPTFTGNADFDGNSYVDGNDFLIWQRGLGLVGQLDTNENGNADNDDDVDGDDLQIWKEQFSRGSERFTIGAAFIDSVGAAGSVNTINSIVHLNNEQLEIAGKTPLTINGNLTYVGDPANSNASAAALRVVNPDSVVTLNGNVAFINNDMVDSTDFRLNDGDRSQGTLIINGVMSGDGRIFVGSGSNSARKPLGTVVLNNNNTFNGSFRAGRGNLILNHNNALGFNPPSDPEDQYAVYRQEGPANQFGYNLIAGVDGLVISNEMIIAQWQTFKGEHSLEWAGEVSQTNNRGIVNNLDPGQTLTFSGRINIFEDGEPDTVREFEFDGSGRTEISGMIRDVPDDFTFTPQDHRLRKTGTGVLRIAVAAGNNNHTGVEIVDMGNLHYANNDSLNAGAGLILARGGAVGVDAGTAGNSAFLAKIDPDSTGGLMLTTAADAAATLDFTGALANAANMTVAAPETGMVFTGSIIPAGGRYQLGGGTGTLTLPNAQLTGGNRLEVRNGGTVELLGDNTYTGSTTILTKYTSTHEAQAAADSNEPNDSVGPVYYDEVAPALIVDKLSNGGVASSIGSAASDAANLFIQGGTLKYVGAGDTTNRLFTIGTGGATIDASGGGAVVFSNTGALGRDDAEDRPGTLDDFNRQPTEMYDVADTSDIVIGMSVTDPDAGFGPPFDSGSPPEIPAGTVVGGVSDDGHTIGMEFETEFADGVTDVLKPNTRIVFGTVPRTLELTGSNTGANTIASLISNSDKGGVVNIEKTGVGTWGLSGNNTYTGTTSVAEGTLLVNGTQSGGGDYDVAAGATIGGSGTLGGDLTVAGSVAPGAAGAAGTLAVSGDAAFQAGSTAQFQIGGTAANQFDQLNLTGDLTAGGTLNVSMTNGFTPTAGNSFDILDFASASGSFTLNLPTLGGGLSWNTASLLSSGTISVMASIAAVPEPTGLALISLGAMAAVQLRRRRALR